MTGGEIRLLLQRVDPRQLREDAGFRLSTVARALGTSPSRIYQLERDRPVPQSETGLRWVRFVAGLERHAAAVTGEAAR